MLHCTILGLICDCSAQSLTLIRMMTRGPAIKSFLWEIHNSPSSTLSLRHIILFRSHHLSHPTCWRPFHPGATLHHSETSTPLRSSPTWRPQLQNQSSNNISSKIFIDTHATPSSRTFITYNASINADSCGQRQIFRHAILPNNSNNHSHYNRFRAWRSFSYNSLSISPPRRHPYQVYMILSLSGKGDHFLNPQSIRIHYYTSSYLW